MSSDILEQYRNDDYIRLLTLIGLRHPFQLNEKVGKGRFVIACSPTEVPVRVRNGETERRIEVPTPEQAEVDLHKRTCDCGLSEEPYTRKAVDPIRGCHHLRFADLRVMAAPQVERYVEYRFGTRLGAILRTFGASNLAEVRERLRTVEVFQVQSGSTSGECSDHAEARLSLDEIERTEGSGVTPQYSQTQCHDDDGSYWLVETEQDLLGE